MNQVDMLEIAGRGPTEMSLGGLVFCGVMFPLGLVIAFNVARMGDRVFLFFVNVVPGPTEMASPRSTRFAGGVLAFLSLIGLVVEIRTGLT
ncbi:hypothetical protein ABTX34_04670 [Streptomyces sp. NPDC096538]|uniref:hypothetical protein n=1 Tax=Streptomyces sp. NPDC096538 TaxID=3155427 RepID=UPI0033266D69